MRGVLQAMRMAVGDCGVSNGCEAPGSLLVVVVRCFPKAIRYTLNNFPTSDEIFMECLASEA